LRGKRQLAGFLKPTQPYVMRDSVPSFGTNDLIPGGDPQGEQCHDRLKIFDGRSLVAVRAELEIVLSNSHVRACSVEYFRTPEMYLRSALGC
jgi:hypothetical protein